MTNEDLIALQAKNIKELQKIVVTLQDQVRKLKKESSGAIGQNTQDDADNQIEMEGF